MATQAVTLSRSPAPGASKSSGVPVPTDQSGADYTLSDLELLGVAEDAAEEQVSGPGETSPKPPEAPDTDTGSAETGDDFSPAFALPGIGSKLREICERESAYRETFKSVGHARAAAAAQQELSRLDALMESRDPRAHAELLAGLQRLSPESFRSLAIAFVQQLPKLDAEAARQVAQALARPATASQAAEAGAAQRPEQHSPETRAPDRDAARLETARRAGQFLEAVNSDAEHAVRAAVEARVDELMADAPQGARQKIAAEVYRELDAALRADPELQEQVRDSVRTALAAESPANRGAWRGAQGEGLARLISRRAKAALPAVAKRVIADWTETVLRSSQARRSRQTEAASRTEIGRGGSPAPVPARPRRVDYNRMSDEEILNME